MATKRTNRAAERGTTAPRTYRFDANLINEFEGDCAKQLRSPRMVLEALMGYWLEASPKLQAEVAERYAKQRKPSND